MKPKEQAQKLFSHIGYGRENAVTRPTNRTIDRYLRDMVARANEQGEVIINVGNGYYKPRFFDPVERMEFEEYINKDISRANRTRKKVNKMRKAFFTGSPGYMKAYEQLSLPV